MTTEVAVLGEEIRARMFPRPQQIPDPETGSTRDGLTPYPMPLEVHYGGMRLIFTAVRSIQRLPGDEEPEEYRDKEGMPLPGRVRVEVDDRFVTTPDLSFGKFMAKSVDLPKDYAPEVRFALSSLFRAVAGVE